MSGGSKSLMILIGSFVVAFLGYAIFFFYPQIPLARTFSRTVSLSVSCSSPTRAHSLQDALSSLRILASPTPPTLRSGEPRFICHLEIGRRWQGRKMKWKDLKFQFDDCDAFVAMTVFEILFDYHYRSNHSSNPFSVFHPLGFSPPHLHYYIPHRKHRIDHDEPTKT